MRFKLLPRLIHANGNERITRVEVYKNLAAVAEPILVRLDLATGVLGWLDETGISASTTRKAWPTTPVSSPPP
ncbi:hypothetical protein ACE0DR_28460 [Azotobacter sp. CWF10]